MRIPSWRRGVMALAGIASGFGCAAAFTLQSKVHAEPVPHPPHLPRSHTGPFESLDHDSIRRGYQVYKQACSACHSMRHFAYRDLVDIGFTEDEAKAEAEEIQDETAIDAINLRPNIAAAIYALNGAVPSDFSYFSNCLALYLEESGEQDYILSFLTGYCSLPAGVVKDDGQYFYDEAVFTEGTPTKDMCTFLVWAAKLAEDERDFRKKQLTKDLHDNRKKMAIKMLAHLLTVITLLIPIMFKALLWSVIKKIVSSGCRFLKERT